MPIIHTIFHRLDNNDSVPLVKSILYAIRASIHPKTDPTTRPGGKPDFVHPFDLASGADTSGYISSDELWTEPANPTKPGFYGGAYYGIAPSTLTEAIKRLPEPVNEFTFVDLGCGKGRALLVAAQFAFRGILGVELAPELCRVAEANIARLNTFASRRAAILEHDASTVTYPDTPLVLFLFHPFLSVVLRKALRNLEEQIRAHPRPVYLLYANPCYFRLFASFTFLEMVWDGIIPYSAEDIAADRDGATSERFALYRSTL